MKITLILILAGLLAVSSSFGLVGNKRFGELLSVSDDMPLSYSSAQWFILQSSNSSLWASNFGTFGGESVYPDYGYRFNTNVYTEPEAYGGSGRSMADSPTMTNYAGYVHSATYSETIDLPAGASSIILSYYAKWDIEDDRDSCEVAYVTSTSGLPDATEWNNLQATSTELCTVFQYPDADRYVYDGTQDTWTNETVDLTSLAGQTIRLGFVFKSDQSNTYVKDGIYIDELSVIADATPVLPTQNFDTELDMWEAGKYNMNGEDWGVSTALPLEVLVLETAQILVGNSTAYVANGSDWAPVFGGDSSGNVFTAKYSNSATVQIGDPEYYVKEYCYIWEDFTIIDCYVKNAGGTTLNNVYIGVANNATIEANDSDRQGNEHYKYESGNDVGKWCNDDGGGGENTDGAMLGIVNLGSTTSTSYEADPDLYAGGDAGRFSSMSSGNHTSEGSWTGSNIWVSIIGTGPYTLNPAMEFTRFTYGYVTGDNETELDTNINACISRYIDIEDHISIRSASLGQIKAMYK